MTIDFRLRGCRCGRAALRCVHSMTTARAIARAAQHLLPASRARPAHRCADLRAAMESAFGASDADGAWDWKTAYDACEAATVLFLRKFGPAMRARAASPAAMLPMLAKIAGLLPTHTRRSEESEALQQFSTPIPLGFAASAAAAITPADVVLEPSAGTGLLAILAELSGASLVLNELAETRAGLLLPPLSRHRRHALRRRAYRRSSRRRHHAKRRADEPAILGRRQRRSPHGRRCLAAYRVGAWRGSPKAAGWSQSPGRVFARTIRSGAMPSSACRNAAASSSPPPLMARSSPSTARPSRRG